MKADNKRGFLLYRDYALGFKSLSKEKAGELICAVFDFVTTGENVDLSPEVLPLYSMIIGRLQEDAAAYNEKCEKNAEAARKRWEEQQKKQQTE